MFKSASKNSSPERLDRANMSKNMMRFGVDFLDHATRGIFRDDLILIGAPSGLGKTQLCCNIALANLEDGKRVHYIALEASEYEIERRLKYPLVFERFIADPNRPRLANKLNFTDWLMGSYLDTLKEYEDQAEKYFESAYRDFFIFYKGENFGVAELIESVLQASGKTDLIIVDHVHYFDFDDDNENRAIKEIAKTVRTLALEELIPIVLVAHLRKRDRNNKEVAAGLDEFMGSSDLYKIATKVITMGPGPTIADGTYSTYFRIPKNRLDGGVTRYLGLEFFNPKKGTYEKGKYQIGKSTQTRDDDFEPIDERHYPDWARPLHGIGNGIMGARNHASEYGKNKHSARERVIQAAFKDD